LPTNNEFSRGKKPFKKKPFFKKKFRPS